jgi:hypothetical protein
MSLRMERADLIDRNLLAKAQTVLHRFEHGIGEGGVSGREEWIMQRREALRRRGHLMPGGEPCRAKRGVEESGDYWPRRSLGRTHAEGR